MSDILSFQHGNVDDALSILAEATQWLIDTGKPMWRIDEISEKTFLARYKAEDIVVGYHGTIPICTCVLQWSDIDFWPEIPAGGSGFLHKVAVRRDYSGSGYIWELIDFSISECRKRNISALRLDCDAGRMKLREYYENLGFIHLDTVERAGYRVCRFELYF